MGDEAQQPGWSDSGCVQRPPKGRTPAHRPTFSTGLHTSTGKSLVATAGASEQAGSEMGASTRAAARKAAAGAGDTKDQDVVSP